jgi:hypothetical protein
VNLLDGLAESRIVEAQRRGEFDDLPGVGAPLCIDDDRLIPSEWRMAYRVLRNAGYLPRAMALRIEAAELEALVAGLAECDERELATRRLRVLRSAVSVTRGTQSAWMDEAAYREQLLDKLDREGAMSGAR